MPYANVPEELWGKMDDCVSKVEEQGHDKESAIRICYTSVVEGKSLDEALKTFSLDSLKVGARHSESDQAALYPADVGYLYFVSKGDGTHYFSMTLSEHAAAIQRVKGTRVVQERSAEKETPGERPPKTAEKGG